MKKLLLSLFFVTLLCPLLKAADYTMTPNGDTTGNTSTAYVTTEATFTAGGIGWAINQWNPNSLQIKTNSKTANAEFYIYNTSAFSSDVAEVVLTFKALSLNSTDNPGWYLTPGTDAAVGINGVSTEGSIEGVWDDAAKTLTFTVSDSGCKYFSIWQNGKVAGGTNKLATENAIAITYASGTPTFTVYFDNSETQWSDVYAHAWTGDTPLVDWPGTKLESETDTYTYTFEADAAPANILFNKGTGGDGNQTGDFTFENGATYNQYGNVEKVQTFTCTYDNSETQWETVYAYYWGGTANSWPGREMTEGTGNIWTIEIYGESAPTSIIFNKGEGGDGNQTGDLEFVNGADYDFNGVIEKPEAPTKSDVLTAASFGLEGSYKDKTATGDSGAEYAINAQKNSSDDIQMRSNNNNSGIVSTKSGGVIRKVIISWSTATTAGRKVDVYAKSTDYSSPKDLYTTATAGDLKGTLEYDKNQTEIEIDGNYTAVGIRSNSGAIYLADVTFVWEEPSADTVLAPSFSVAAGEVFEGTEVVLTCATEGASIYYTLDGEDPTAESTLYTAPIVISEPCTIKAVAVKDGKSSSVASASYTLAVVYTSLAEVKALAKNTEFNFGAELTVVYSNGAYNYVYDGENFGLIYKAGLNLNAGDVIAKNWAGKVSYYSNLIELVPNDNALPTTDATGEIPAPVEVYDYNVDEIITAANQDLYVNLNNVTVTEDDITGKNVNAMIGKNVHDVTGDLIDEGKSILLYNQFSLEPEPGIYDLMGFVSVHNEDVQVYYITAMDERATTGVENIVVSENGNAVYYNLQGVRVDNPTSGIYVRRQGNKATKVIIK